MSKVVLVTASAKGANYGITINKFAAIPPNIPLGLLDAYMVSKGVPTEVIDSEVEGLTYDELVDRLLEEAPLLVGVIACGANPSASTMSMVGVLKFFKKLNSLKEIPKKNICMGRAPHRSARAYSAGDQG